MLFWGGWWTLCLARICFDPVGHRHSDCLCTSCQYQPSAQAMTASVSVVFNSWSNHARQELSNGERWYVVQSLAKREAGAAAQLNAQGFSIFLPQGMRTIRHARKLRTERVPIFPGYLFVVLDLDRDLWRSVNGTFGVSRLIMARDAPCPVPQGVVEALYCYLDEDGVCRFDRDLDVGQAIRVVTGPFAQAIGRLDRLDANGRVRVLLEILGGKVHTLLDRSARFTRTAVAWELFPCAIQIHLAREFSYDRRNRPCRSKIR
jgi:transcription antitermination factor NusG